MVGCLFLPHPLHLLPVHLWLESGLLPAFGSAEHSCSEPFLSVSLCGHMFSFLLGKFLEMELLGHGVGVCLVLEKQLEHFMRLPIIF